MCIRDRSSSCTRRSWPEERTSYTSTQHRPPRGTQRGCGAAQSAWGVQRYWARVPVWHEDRATGRWRRS
eukprot:13233427-Alexandrium_andersonii.AAC.1